ncbi:EAL domain-containing protein [Ideonella sp. DXS22W]|uniref:EAL domain-containing protein n=1 Tax=Pseudaquabacterium inlustre TaxID=2984192 RepID=A0ABU9CHZ3_9BURK
MSLPEVNATADPVPTATATAAAVVHRLLLVDDDRLLRGMASRTLRHAGFEVCEVDSGEQALALVCGTDAEPVDLVLLDVMMDGIDGFETCRRLRAQAATAAVPVLMLTGLNDTESIEQSYQAGATDFITKPIHWGLLAHRVRYALRASAARAALEHSRESLVRAQRLAHMGSWQLNAQGQLACTPELGLLYAAPADAAHCATAEAMLARVLEADRERVAGARAAALDDGTPYHLSFMIERFDGQRRTVVEHAAPLLDAHGRIHGVEGITQDITERAEAEREVRRLALYDPLTGLPNRQFFLELAGSALERARRAGAVCAVLHLDIDQFKTVNDALGRAGGDRVLRTVAERLQTRTRAGDLTSVGAQASEMVARIGPNGFTLMLVDIGHDGNAGSAAERLIHEVERPILLGERDVVLTTGVGIAVFPRDGTTASELAAHAEQALYAAKRAGRSQHRFFDEGLNAVARERLARETALRHAIEGGQLCLHFQPKVDARDGRIVGAEALVRWQHPERGLVMPGEFIPLAEETGLIAPLTDWVLDAACRAVASWPVAVPVSVNVASTAFMADGLLEKLDAVVQRHGIAPQRLMVEVTESMLMAGADAAIARLEALRAAGFKLSLDDFGTGFSSLSYVKRFPIDELKIDRAFVQDVDRGGKDMALVASIITLARLLDLQVVAEGVETAAQAEHLGRLGCHIHQGWRYARPLPRDRVLPLLQAGVIQPG